jgi:hypothetical protein
MAHEKRKFLLNILSEFQIGIFIFVVEDQRYRVLKA